MMTPDPATVAAGLRRLADGIEAGTIAAPLLEVVTDSEGFRLRVIPAELHDALCRWRIATPQDTTPVVLGCAGCGFCYPRQGVEV